MESGFTVVLFYQYIILKLKISNEIVKEGLLFIFLLTFSFLNTPQKIVTLCTVSICINDIGLAAVGKKKGRIVVVRVAKLSGLVLWVS